VALLGNARQKFLYVADGHNERVHVLDRQTLEEIPGSAFGHAGPYPGQFSNIHVIASDSKGNVYVGDGAGRFQKFVYKAMSH
jgi:DNA-binding beta-propeller fold protein YncE